MPRPQAPPPSPGGFTLCDPGPQRPTGDPRRPASAGGPVPAGPALRLQDAGWRTGPASRSFRPAGLPRLQPLPLAPIAAKAPPPPASAAAC